MQSTDLLRDYLGQPQPTSFTAQYTTLRKLHHFLCDPATAEHIERTGTQSAYAQNLEALLETTAAALFPGHGPSGPRTFREQVLQHVRLAMLDSLCDDTALRVKFASRWLTEALRYMHLAVIEDERDHPSQSASSGQKALPYFLSRACCGVLVNIAKSGETHSHFTDFAPLARCIRYSSDIYLQLQCCEVIFCVSRTKRELLETATPLLGEPAVEKIEKLAATPRVLFDMCDIIRNVPSRWGTPELTPNNAAMCVINASAIAVPPLLQNTETAVDEKLWYRHSALDGGLTRVFFGKTMLVLDWAFEPELTIPYAAVKAIKLNRNKQLVIKLNDVPFSMRAIHEEMAGRLAQVGVPPEAICQLSRADGVPLRYSEVSQGFHSSQESNDNGRSFPEIIVNITHEEYRIMRDAKIQQWITAEIAAAKGASAAEEPPFTPERGVEPREVMEESPEAPVAENEQPAFSAVPMQPMPPLPSSLPPLFPQQHHAERMPAPQSAAPQYTDEIDPLLHELRQVVTQKVNSRHQEGQRILDEAKRRIEAEVEAFHAKDDARHALFRENMNGQIDKMRATQRAMQARMSNFIEKLNLDVRSMAEQSKILDDQCTVMGLEVSQGVEGMRAQREGQVRAMQETVGANLRALEAKIHAAVSSTNPLRFMTQFLAQADERMSSSQRRGE